MNRRTAGITLAAVSLVAVAVGCQAPRAYHGPSVNEGLTLGQLSDLLTREGIRHHVDRDHGVIVTGYETDRYRDGQGGRHVRIVLELSGNGQLLQMRCGGAYVHRGEFSREVAALCLALNYRTRIVEVEYDPRDGEVAPGIDLPLVPGQYDGGQVAACLKSLVYFLDEFDPAFRAVLATGRLPRSAEIDPGLQQLMEAFEGVFRGERFPIKPAATRGQMI